MTKIPAKIGRYEILEKVGSGRTGTVFRASDPLIGRILAIKTFRVDLTPGPIRDTFLQRFYHEARISGGLSHPNIVALFDVGEEDGLPYLVFEHVEGPTLDVALARAGRLDSAETIRVVEQTAAALDFAHARGIVHRDIRPANIILANDKRVRIADFGIARVEGSQLTQHGEVLGTPAYMSPEQIRGQELTAETDLFSLAVCAYEMLSGNRPFAGKTQPELFEALVYSPPAEPKELRSLGIPSREFMFVFERALAKDPAHRFADAASFARALKSCLGVVAPGDEPAPISRIAIPDPPRPAHRQILPPVAPPPAQRYAASNPGIKPPQPPSSSDPSADATFVSSPSAGDDSSEELASTLGFDSGINSKQVAAAVAAAMASSASSASVPLSPPSNPSSDASADATMVSGAQDFELPSTHRMSRAAVEDVLSKSGANQKSSSNHQKSRAEAHKVERGGAASAIEDLLPPTREMPKLSNDLGATGALSPAPPPRPATDPSRTASNAGGLPKATDKTLIMTDAEKVSAAKLRDLSAARLPTRAAQKSIPPPPPPPTRTVARPLPPSLAPPVPSSPAIARPSLVPKILLAVIVLMTILAAMLGVLFWGRAQVIATPVVEKWNDLPVYPEADVDKSPLLFSHEIPKPKVDHVLSVTLSWIVTPDGVVDEPKIVVSASKEIDAFVIQTVKKWRYEPGQKAGKTVPVRLLRKYTFQPRENNGEGN
ncbi:MAG: protein kinase [Vicinamibacteria bacterium]